ncbi:hypothetical protein BDB01DRAFT_806054 [Pilobolus umbonatus]|nr:hypothetical protein BDB01DRAFT_830289 [Pilobolus umbonatus]KAI8974387.1 hypothetical protein BDB01DRAFT_807262 [Pilobolus umbonatus]KAI8974679.1 hypothetical protein BDB01DRAFT_806054 [Pilobolus umbonatus]
MYNIHKILITLCLMTSIGSNMESFGQRVDWCEDFPFTPECVYILVEYNTLPWLTIQCKGILAISIFTISDLSIWSS